jgi:transcriptional regulator with XRE-family HTH domain
VTVGQVVGANIRRLRRADEITQETLAFRAAVHRTQITLIERGRRNPGIDTFLRLAGALEVEAAVLLGGCPLAGRRPWPGTLRRPGGPMNEQEAGEKLGQNLRRTREAKGLSRRRLGLRADLAEDTIYKIEKATRMPRISTLLILCTALDVEVDVLLEGIEWTPGEGSS